MNPERKALTSIQAQLDLCNEENWPWPSVLALFNSFQTRSASKTRQAVHKEHVTQTPPHLQIPRANNLSKRFSVKSKYFFRALVQHSHQQQLRELRHFVFPQHRGYSVVQVQHLYSGQIYSAHSTKTRGLYLAECYFVWTYHIIFSFSRNTGMNLQTNCQTQRKKRFENQGCLTLYVVKLNLPVKDGSAEKTKILLISKSCRALASITGH